MLIHPQFDPVAISIGPLSIHWYGIMYMLGFIQFMLLGNYRIKHYNYSDWDRNQLEELLLYAMLGVIIGGRLGEVLFYSPGYYFKNPTEIIAIWKGGMSFHGGFIGVLFSTFLWGRSQNKPWYAVTDFIAPLTPLGLAFGRVGNFINGELWGRVTSPDLPWAMVFPRAGDSLPRHPSQLYHIALEGILLFIILWWFAGRTRVPKATTALFFIGYGTFRFITEYFREPDVGIFGHSYNISMGQWLSLPMIIIGIVMFYLAHDAHRKQTSSQPNKK